MDPKVWGKLLTHHRRGYGVDVEALCDQSPSGGVPEKAPDGISRVQKVAAVELGFCGAPGCLGGTWIYIGGTSTSVEQRRAHEGGGRAQGGRCAPASWIPCWLLDVHSKSSGSRLFQKSCPRRFHSVWTPFDILFLRNTEIGKKTAIWARPLVNRLVPKII